MKRLHFAIRIDAPAETVWEKMLGPDTYRDWTTQFAEGSYFEGTWEQGSKMRFLSPGGSGMLAVIAENRPHQFLSIQHVGMVDKGVEDTESEAVRSWAPAFENYTFVRAGGSTDLAVELDVAPEWEDYMQQTWPKALARLEEICEAR